MKWYQPIIPSLVFGLFLGLSGSPVLGLTITAAFGLVAAFFKPEVAKLLLPIPNGAVQFLSIFLAIGALAGIYIRANDSLKHDRTMSQKLSQLGFQPAQIERIVDHEFRVAAGSYSNLRNDAKDLGFTPDEINLVMDRMTKSIVLPVGHTPQPATNVTKSGVGASSSPNRESDSKLFAGLGNDWYQRLRGTIANSPDEANSAEQKQIESELRTMRSFLADLNEKLKISATLPSQQIELLHQYQLFLDALLNPMNGASLKSRRFAASSVERKIDTLAQ